MDNAFLPLFKDLLILDVPNGTGKLKFVLDAQTHSLSAMENVLLSQINARASILMDGA